MLDSIPAAAATGLEVPSVDTRRVQDTVFVIDTTYSMHNDIELAKAQSARLGREILERNPGSRVAIVEYRDWAIPFEVGGKKAAARVVQDFTSDPNAFRAGIDRLQHRDDGNPDDPEDMLSGIYAAYALGWRDNVARNVVVIGDAPAHDPECATGLTMQKIIDFANGNATKLDISNYDGTGATSPTGCDGTSARMINGVASHRYAG